jgi:GR25 family glycosyltransferase involved in LPS biosynthesis
MDLHRDTIAPHASGRSGSARPDLRAIVINLTRRSDRMAQFEASVSRRCPTLTIERLHAIDGAVLDLDDALRARINPWNIRYLGDSKLRAVVACALSHLKAWELLANGTASHALIFEDDARFIDPALGPRLDRIFATLPVGADLVWLNEYERPPRRDPLLRLILGIEHHWRIKRSAAPTVRKYANRLKRSRGVNFDPWPARTEKTAEAYILSRSFAAKLIAAIGNDLGAIDEHIRGYVEREGGAVFAINPPLFRQADGLGTDIQL